MRKRFLGLLACLCFAFAARGQVLTVKVNGTPRPAVGSGVPFDVDLSGLSGIVLVHIYDSVFGPDGFPVGSAGKIALTGTPGTLSAITEVRLLVAGGDEIWPTRPTDALASTGIRHLGTSDSSGIDVPDPVLRPKTRLAAFTSHDIRGNIVVGQVYRLQCGFNPDDSTHNGTIYSNITTIARDRLAEGGGGGPDPVLAPTYVPAIAYIKAGNAILGNLTTFTDTTYSSLNRGSYASIGRVIVGNSLMAGGIQGNIKAEAGKIFSLVTSGPIGGASALTGQNRTPQIWAGNGIEEILGIPNDTPQYGGGEATPLTLAPANFQMDLQASRAFTAVAAPLTDAPLFEIRTGGDIAGTIHVANLTAQVRGSGSRRGRGIVAGQLDPYTGAITGGRITADIIIDHVMESNIVGRTIEGNITIGRALEGSIIAADFSAEAPPIQHIRIGMLGDEPAYNPNDPASNYATLYGTGFVGQNTSCSLEGVMDLRRQAVRA